MKTLLVPVFLLASLALPAIFAWNNEVIDYRLSYADLTCNTTGLLCKNCSYLVFCTSDGTGGWTETEIMTCPAGEVCSNTNKKCVTGQSTECSPTADVPFPCSTVGVFPNPGDCKYYHMCYPDDNGIIQEVKILCQNNETYYYNPKTYFCDKKLPTGGKCPSYPIPLCKTVGDSAPLRENPSLYYVCLPSPTDPGNYYPYQMACENGKIYSAVYGCR